MVDFINLKNTEKDEKKFLSEYKKLLSKTSFIGGKEVKSFESSFAQFLNCKYCIGVANGTDALEIALESLNLPKNSEIIVPNFTFLSPAEAVIRGGYKLILADVETNSFNIDLKNLEKLITKKTRAIILVHLFGRSCEMDRAMALKRKYRLKIIEDCSQAHGADFNNKKLGTIGDFGTFSFYPTKNLGAFGDAGCLVTNSKKNYEKAKKIANHGRVDTYDHVLPGRNSRLDSIQANILNYKLKSLNRNNLIRINQAKRYINFINKNKLPIRLFSQSLSCNVFHQFPIIVDEREKLIDFLKSKSISSGVYYPKPLSSMKAFRNNSNLKKFKDKNSTFLSKNIVSLPIGQHLNKKDIEKVLFALELFFRDKA
tara:strand:- start:5190 stop:6299 length:1110 start_codon:yes stop_codon:yes gene_type:complete